MSNGTWSAQSVCGMLLLGSRDGDDAGPGDDDDAGLGDDAMVAAGKDTDSLIQYLGR